MTFINENELSQYFTKETLEKIRLLSDMLLDVDVENDVIAIHLLGYANNTEPYLCFILSNKCNDTLFFDNNLVVLEHKTKLNALTYSKIISDLTDEEKKSKIIWKRNIE